jgi:prepilin-type N-terminal cleavage/methylation domain-containing protein
MKNTAQNLRLKRKLSSKSEGFTLVELLVVIAIIAILAAVVALVINPLELTRRGRDATRLSDFANIQQAINVAVQEATSAGGVTTILCSQGGASCTGSSHTGTRVPNGTGWVKVDLATQRSVTVPTLPVDPVNDATYHYTYCGDTDVWKIIGTLESSQQSPKMTTDGGSDNARYEVGSDLTIACTY